MPTTDVFLHIVREQMETKSWVKNNIVQIRFLFGKLKAGLEIKNDQELNGYTCKDFGNGIHFLRNETPTFPFICKVGSLKRDECWNKPSYIIELVASLYKNNACKLYHGFLKDHSDSFFHIIPADVSIQKDVSVFLSSLNDHLNHPLSTTIIDLYSLAGFMCSHQNDIIGSPMPKT